MTLYRGGFLRIITADREYTYEAMKEDIRRLKSEYPFLEVFSIGNSVLGKEIPCIRWGQGDKKIFINGAHHGKEWITALLLLRMLEELCYHYQNRTAVGCTDIHQYYRSASVYFCPMVNPDGVNLCINGLTDNIPLPIRTRLIGANKDSKDFVGKWQANIRGVDLNHNYDAAFAKGKFYEGQLGIFTPAPTRYSGESPESEPESQAVAGFTRSLSPDIVLAYHSQGEVIYYDFEGKATPRAKQMAKDLSELSGYGLDESDGMASCSGYKDWVIQEFYIPAFTIEVGLGENPLPLSQFDKIFDDNLKILLYFAQG